MVHLVVRLEGHAGCGCGGGGGSEEKWQLVGEERVAGTGEERESW